MINLKEWGEMRVPKVYLTEAQKENELIKRNLVMLQGGLTCAQMGKILGVSKSTYINRLKEPSHLTIQELNRLCKYFRVNITSFLTGELTLK